MNPIIKKYGQEKRWVNYKLVTKDGKLTKVPVQLNGKLASSTDQTTWSTYDEVKAKLPEKIGIIFTESKTLVGIDIDHCIEDGKITEHKEIVEKLIAVANTYTEISPSGTGLHFFLETENPFTPKANKKKPFEIYTSGRYFTFTNNPFGEMKEVRVVTEKELDETILPILGYPWDKTTVSITKGKSTPSVSPTSDDNDLLNKMFASKNGQNIKSLYHGDTTKYNGDESSADLALCLHFAFWTNKNYSQIERMWLSSPLGSRDKTKKREDYRSRTIQTAISKCTETYTIPTEIIVMQESTGEIDLLFTERAGSKVYILNTENIYRILSQHIKFKGKLRFDVFRNVIEINEGNKWRGIEDSDIIFIQTQISILFPQFAKVGKDMVFDAMIKSSKESQIDSAKDWLSSLNWDGKKRLDTWLHEVYGAPKDELHRTIGSNWIKGLVKRIVEPGCKFDYVLVLEGPQGTKKSTSLHVLGQDWHVETTMSTDTKDFFMQFQGKAIIEFSEGETLSRTEVKRMKAIITMQFDKYRPPYERTSRDFPRRCVFAMTTNQAEYLKDETGNRRWLPVALRLPKANIEWLQESRNQLFAEAYHRVVTLKETVYEFPERELEVAQEERRILDPNTDLISDWYFNKLSDANRNDGITTQQVYRDAMCGSMPTKPLDRFNEMGIANILRLSLGLEKVRDMRNGIKATRWFPPGGQKKLVAVDPVEDIIINGNF